MFDRHGRPIYLRSGVIGGPTFGFTPVVITQLAAATPESPIAATEPRSADGVGSRQLACPRERSLSMGRCWLLYARSFDQAGDTSSDASVIADAGDREFGDLDREAPRGALRHPRRLTVSPVGGG